MWHRIRWQKIQLSIVKGEISIQCLEVHGRRGSNWNKNCALRQHIPEERRQLCCWCICSVQLHVL